MSFILPLRLTRLAFVSVLTISLLLVSSQANAQTTNDIPIDKPLKSYKMIEVGAFNNDPETMTSETFAINDKGDIVGAAQTAFSLCPNFPQLSCSFARGYLAKRKGRRFLTTEIGPVPGDVASIALDINNKRLAVGVTNGITLPPGIPIVTPAEPMVWRNNTAKLLQTLSPSLPEGQALGVNERGTIVGTVQENNQGDKRAAFWNGPTATPTLLPSLPGATDSLAKDVNNRNVKVGVSDFHPVMWDKNGNISNLLPKRFGTADAINDNGLIVGQVFEFFMGIPAVKPVIWENGNIHILEIFAGIAKDVNNRNQVVGGSGVTDNDAFLWENGNVFFLRDIVLDSDGWTFEIAQGINEREEIAVSAKNPDGKKRALRLVPVK